MSQCLTCKKAMSCTLDWKNQGNWVSCTAYVQPVTNADRIRSMSDKELAEWICSLIIDRYIGVPVEAWLNWLQQEAE